MSSHVLEDVARTCDAVVVLRDGTLAASRVIDHDQEAESGELRVRVSGDEQAFLSALGARGVEVRSGEDHLTVRGENRGQTLDAIRDAAAESGVGLRELTAAGPTLEDALIGAMQ